MAAPGAAGGEGEEMVWDGMGRRRTENEFLGGREHV